MTDPSHYRRLEALMHAAPIIELTGCRATISEGRAEMTIPVARNLMHGAACISASKRR